MIDDAALKDRIARALDDVALVVPEAAVVAMASKPPRWSAPRIVAFATVPILAVTLAAFALGNRLATPEPAFASWQGIPSVADPALASAAVGACLDTADREGTLLLQDQRGKAAALLYRTTDSLISCVVAFDSNGQVVASSSAGRRIAGTFDGFGLDGLSRSAGGPGSSGLTRVYGHVPPNAGSVLLALSDGISVTATSADGWFLAWWPTDAEIESLTAFAADGSTLQQIRSPETTLGS